MTVYTEKPVLTVCVSLPKRRAGIKEHYTMQTNLFTVTTCL